MSASGYRLPTEAEWEKAARGGLNGKLFPWGDTICRSQANYIGDTYSCSYDLGPDGSNPIYAKGNYPYTSPVGSFAANGYGLYDMAGNVSEWCWDLYGSYGSGTDSTGPASGSDRVMRGGLWSLNAKPCRVANRASINPTSRHNSVGFRCVLKNGCFPDDDVNAKSDESSKSLDKPSITQLRARLQEVLSAEAVLRQSGLGDNHPSLIALKLEKDSLAKQIQ